MSENHPRHISRSSPVSTQITRVGLWILSRPFVWTYRIFDRIFGLDQRGAASNLKRLRQEVESDCEGLFSTYGGGVVPELSRGSPRNDFACVVVEVRSLQLRATRDRSYTSWEISSRTSPWEPLEDLCEKLAPKNQIHSPWRFLNEHLLEIEQVLAGDSRSSST